MSGSHLPMPGETRLFSLLRTTGVDVVEIWNVAAIARSGGVAGVATSALGTTMNCKTKAIEARLAEADQLMRQDDAVANLWADGVQRVSNLWSQARDAWLAAHSSQMTVDAFASRLEELIYQISVITVPDRVRKLLQDERVGGRMDFGRHFAADIPTEVLRTRVLAWLNDNPCSTPGVIDLPAGAIIRASDNPWRRALSWLLIAGVMVIAFTAAATTRGWIRALGIGTVPEQSTNREYLLVVAASYAGAIAHVLVSALKQDRGTAGLSNRSLTALGNFTIWVHVHEQYLMLYALAIPVTAYALILTTGTINLVTVFLLGYSIDSILDVLLARFDSAAKTQSEVVAKALRVLGP